MTLHDTVSGHVITQRSDDLAARVLAAWTVTICILAFALAVTSRDDAGRSFIDRDAAQVMNYVSSI